jgi:hypothetical protein
MVVDRLVAEVVDRGGGSAAIAAVVIIIVIAATGGGHEDEGWRCEKKGQHPAHWLVHSWLCLAPRRSLVSVIPAGGIQARERVSRFT